MASIVSSLSPSSPSYSSVRAATLETTTGRALSSAATSPQVASPSSKLPEGITIPDILKVVKKFAELVTALLSLFSSEKENTTARSGNTSLQAAPGEPPLAATGEFLWKPASDKDGNLAILLPSSLQGKVAHVEVLSPDGSEVATSEFAGVGNGHREHYRLGVPGDYFSDGSVVRITMADGSSQQVTIADTSARFSV